MTKDKHQQPMEWPTEGLNSPYAYSGEAKDKTAETESGGRGAVSEQTSVAPKQDV